MCGGCGLQVLREVQGCQADRRAAAGSMYLLRGEGFCLCAPGRPLATPAVQGPMLSGRLKFQGNVQPAEPLSAIEKIWH